MKFIKLIYFGEKNKNICGADIRNKEYKSDLINVNLISSVSDVCRFNNPLSGGYVGDYAIVTMNNRDTYSITPDKHELLIKYLKL